MPLRPHRRECRELRQEYRWIRYGRWLPGLAALGGLYGAAVPLDVPAPDLDRDWREYLLRSRLAEGV